MRKRFKLPEETQKQKEARIKEAEEYVKTPIDRDYLLGYLLGEKIFPQTCTLSTDMIQSRNVIKVAEEEEREFERLSKLHDDEPTKENWGRYKEYSKFLNLKYLPKSLEIWLPRFPDELKIKEGMRQALWDSDGSNYDFEPDKTHVTVIGVMKMSVIIVYLTND